MLTAKSLRFEWLLAVALSCALNGYAQQGEKPAQEETAEVPETASSGQVEANEDIYRQFMELQDGLQRRDTAPQESWQAGARLEKLEELPEDSQKHLRNQLREIIVAGEAWQPGDEDKEYPYVPSVAAVDNRRLQNQEAGAWVELLDSYHAREAQIHANAERSSAASVSPGPQGDTGQAAMEAQGQDSRGGQPSQQAADSANVTADSFSPSMQAGASAGNQPGVAQSAMEFLQQSGYRAGSGPADQPGQMERQAQLAQQQGQGQAGQAADAQQSQAAEQASAQSQSATAAAGMSMPVQAAAGAEQSAMQYLQQAGNVTAQSTGEAGGADGQAQTVDQQEMELPISPAEAQVAADSGEDEPSSEGVSQSALEYLSGERSSGAPADTLSIEDLLDAQGIVTGGVSGSAGTTELPADPEQGKDGGGS